MLTGQCIPTGVDVILDDALQPKIIEINGLPSMQLSQNQGDAIDMADAYTLQKLHIAHDLVSLLFRPHSAAQTLATHLDAARIGLRPGAGCHRTDHVDWYVPFGVELGAVVPCAVYYAWRWSHGIGSWVVACGCVACVGWKGTVLYAGTRRCAFHVCK